MPETPPGNLTTSDWPANGLERVPNCPVCGSTRRQMAYEGLTDRVFQCAPGRWNLYRCNECSSAYLDPRPTPATISRAYSSYYTHAKTEGTTAKADSWLRRCRIAQRNHFLNGQYGYRLEPSAASFFVSKDRQRRYDRYAGYLHFPGQGAKLLDVGCGNGSFLLQMKSLGWDVYGVEPDSNAAEQARAAGLDVKVGQLSDVVVPEGHFDAIVLSHVIEHLHDPGDILGRCWKLLKPDGKIVIYTPNYDACGRVQFGPCWRGLEAPRHLVLFTEKSLGKALERCGFKVSRVPRPPVNARAMFRMSYLLRDEFLGVSRPSRLPLFLRLKCDWLAFKAGQAAQANPQCAEELILIGSKAAGA